MEFIYLKRSTTEHGDKLETHVPSRNDAALLKARTLLTVLSDLSLLEKDVNSTIDWITYYPSYNNALKNVASTTGHPDDDEIVAIIPVKPFKPIWEQPGIAYVQSSFEIQTLFLESFLSSSKKWLHNHPDKLNEIKERIGVPV